MSAEQVTQQQKLTLDTRQR